MEKEPRQHRGLRARLGNKKTLVIIAVLILMSAGGGAVAVKASDAPVFCASCHLMKPYYESWHQGNLLAQKHAEQDVDCHDCHESSISIKAEEGMKYISGDYKTPLSKRQFSKDFCLKCHDFEKVKRQTRFEESNPHESHNDEQECNVCHSMHQESKVMCTQCHSFNWTNELDSSWEK